MYLRPAHGANALKEQRNGSKERTAPERREEDYEEEDEGSNEEVE